MSVFEVARSFISGKTFIPAAVLLLSLAAADYSHAANHYVRAGATGNGSGADWVNAYPALPSWSSLVRGDTYYIADGSYSSYTFRTAVSGSAYISLVKATGDNPQCTGVAGWNDSYGDGVASFDAPLAFTTSYWIFDGVTGKLNAGHGFKVNPTSCNDGNRMVTLNVDGISHIQLKHTEIEHCMEGEHGVTVPRLDTFNAISFGDPITNILLSDCYMHDTTRVMIYFNRVRDSIVENCYFERRRGGNLVTTGLYIHGEAITVNYCGTGSNNIFRNNIFKDIHGTGALVIKDSVQGDMQVYGNLFYHTNSNYMYQNGAVTNTSGDTNTNMLVHNNTFANINGSAEIEWYQGSGNVAYNNIWYNSSPGFRNTAHDYNLFINSGSHTEANDQYMSSHPFISPSQENFRLAVPTLAGVSLPLPMDFDISGLQRGADGVWDRGAYEFTGKVLLPPFNFRVESIE